MKLMLILVIFSQPLHAPNTGSTPLLPRERYSASGRATPLRVARRPGQLRPRQTRGFRGRCTTAYADLPPGAAW